MQPLTEEHNEPQGNSHNSPRLTESSHAFIARIRSNELLVTLCFYVPAILAISLKVYRLGSRELWLDETYSALLAGMPFKQTIQYTIGDVHPPLFYVLLWAWVRLVGCSEIALRFFSVVLNTTATIGFFFALRNWLGTRPAVFGSLLFALSPILFVYSLEVRMYMLVVCWVVAILSIHRVVTSETNVGWSYIVLYSLLCAFLYYTHYIGLFVLMGLFIDWVIATRFRPNQLWRLSAAAFLTILLMASWIPIMFQQRARKLEQTHALAMSYEDPAALTFGESPGKATLSDHVRSYIPHIGVVVGLYPGRSVVSLMGLGLPIVLLLVGAICLAVRGDPAGRLFLIITLAVFAGIVLLGLDETRYFLPILPFMFLAMSRTLQEWNNSRLRPMATALAVIVLVIYAAGFTRQVTRNHPRPWSSLVDSLKHNYGQNDVVVFDVLYGQVVFDYYANQVGFHPQELGFPESIYTWWEQKTFKGWGGPIVHRADVESTASVLENLPGPKTVWLVLYEVNYYDPQEALLKRISEMGKTVEFQSSRAPSTFSPNAPGEHPRLFVISAE